ncbi:DUF2177 family protein [Oharaeibacter diazotrophicus]|uniref:Putative membrane protein n=1 Tax=Oharaeibacter diazotrophicus TaxID=1920512 RepID=A0A4R6RJF0_9HYPH|nr:DUF2177 family protein [Oharaeibacter diazotrophicus]TDP86689.1 putative membrane protein [Oharaeibacter diazotrophicus]BBE71369.1 hypothetical protein OHA_1_00942 [Pleomorphomonas sp. SM30]GLS78125.1 membrane protein [Oharaeibacter diazotrophicus]
MTRLVAAYLAGVGTFLAVDLLWLSVIARDIYRREIGALLLERPLVGPAAAFYLIYVAGVVVFAVNPALSSSNWTTAALYGGLLGMLCYGTYDVTNLATLRNWSSTIVVVDIAWGTLLTAVTATVAYLVAARFG